MKWQQFVSSMGINKLFKGLMTLACIKLCLVGMMVWQMQVPQLEGKGVARVVNAAAVSVAHAQQADNTDEQKAREQADSKAMGGKGRAVSEAAPKGTPLNADALARKKAELDRRERELKKLEAKINKDISQLEERRAQIKRMLDDAKAVRTKKDKHLVDVFSNMKAKQAANVLETMDERQAVKILSGMRGRQAGEILTYVQAEKAARLAEQLTKLQIPFD